MEKNNIDFNMLFSNNIKNLYRSLLKTQKSSNMYFIYANVKPFFL